MTNSLRVGSLCTGIGGLELGLAMAGVPVELEWLAETDRAALTVLAAHHPGVSNLGDVRAVEWSHVGAVDVLTAGFPCQDVSVAGIRLGLAPGTRSGLWLHIAEAIDALRPPLVLLENVRGILSSSAAISGDLESCPWCVGVGDGKPLRALGAVLGTLADLGYDASWYSLPAAEVSATHLRWRVFILAWPADSADAPSVRHGHAGTAGGQRLATAAVSGGLGPNGLTGDPLLPTPAARDGGMRGMCSPQAALLRRAQGHTLNLEDAIATLTLLPTPEAKLARSGPDYARLSRPQSGGDDLATAVHKLLPTPRATEGTKGSPASRGSAGDLSLSAAVQPQHWGKYAPAVERWERVIGRAAPLATMPGPKGGVRLSPQLVEWMVGLPDGYVTGHASRNDALRLLGNIAMPLQVASAVAPLVTLSDLPLDQIHALASSI